MARQHETRMFELRAVMSLARLWIHQGQPHEAHQLLAEVCEQFTEGFDTCELKAASELRKELA
jgi:adenylate cyclase